MNEVREDDEDSISLLDLAIVVAENIKLLLIGPLLIGFIALGVTFLIKPTFTAKAVFLPPQQQQQSAAASVMQSLGALGGLAGAAAGVKSPADQYIALMQSATVSNRIIDAHKLAQVYDSSTREDARKALASNVKIDAGKKDGLITVAVDDTDPKRAAAIANDYVSQLSRFTSELALTDAQQRRAFFERQLQQTRDKLAAAQRELQGSGISEGTLRAEPQAAAEAYAAIKAQVTVAEVRLRTMRGYLTEEAAEFKAAQSNLLALQAQLSKAGAADKSVASDDYISKYREFKYQETLFELFAKQFEMAKLDESREGALVQVVDAATPPEWKSKPKRASVALVSTLLAGFALLIFVFVRQGWRNMATDAESAQKLARLRAVWHK